MLVKDLIKELNQCQEDTEVVVLVFNEVLGRVFIEPNDVVIMEFGNGYQLVVLR